MRTLQTKTAISTYEGDFFDYENPEQHDYSIETIAHALANICRYGGHCNKFYSVAEHSVLVSRLVPKEFAFEGLMHDASEAYCGDVASPLKRLIPDYRKIEDRVQAAIAKHFNLVYPFPEDIHVADKIVYRTERNSICSVEDTLWFTDLPVDKNIMIACMQPKDAKAFFLHRYRELTGQYSDRDQQVRRQKEARAKAA